jgi:cardiolipin synthase
MWNAIKENDIDDVTFDKYLKNNNYKALENGFIAPFADSPMDKEQVGEEVYMSMANMAKDYVWYITPYLIITEEMIHAFSLAAKRGVDVRIVTPGIPDKKIVYSVTRSYYNALAKNGVRIYEYSPGFCHAKMSICDDFAATCGTINLDYRSLFHHFENGVLLYKVDAIADVKKDFINTFEVSEEVTEKAKQKPNLFMRFIRSLLRLIAPLL